MGNQYIGDAGYRPVSVAPDFGNAAAINAFMNAQAAQSVRGNLPGYDSLIGQDSVNIGSNLRGEIPPDVLRLLQQQAAERGVATGSPGSDNTNASYLQALGLTSLGLQEQGQKGLTAAVDRTPVPQLFNPASLFVPQTLGAQELAAARGGMGQGDNNPAYQRGGVSYLPSPGRTPSRASGSMIGAQSTPTFSIGSMMTNEAIMAIANGELQGMGGGQRIQDPGMAPAPNYNYSPGFNPYDDSDVPPGWGYNPNQDTYDYDPDDPFAGFYN